MAVTFAQPQKISDTQWLVSWTSTLSPCTYYVYLDGVLASAQTAETFTVNVAPGQPAPMLEVLDAAGDPSPAFPNYLALGWLRDADAYAYQIEEYVASVWTLRETILATVLPWQTYFTAALADCVTAQWRVKPVDAAGNIGTAVEFTALIVRYPDVPAVDFSYSAATGKVTISAAS
jgi:hypothetical protein